MPVNLLLRFDTRKGPVYIAHNTSIQRFQILWKDEALGNYTTVAGAVGDVAGGHVFTPSDGADLGELGISADPLDWLRCR